MPRYKDIDAILKKLLDDLPYKASVKRVLMQAPEADVVPAAIGEWLENEDGCQCSHCGLQQYGEYDAECMPEFCPSCFARMYCKLDGEEYAKVESFRREKEARLAREIFEEIEKFLEVALMNGHIETPILCIGFGTFFELKKKHTGGQR